MPDWSTCKHARLEPMVQGGICHMQCSDCGSTVPSWNMIELRHVFLRMRAELDQVYKERDKLAVLFMDQMVALMKAKKNPCKECIVHQDCIEEGRCCSDWALKWAKEE